MAASLVRKDVAARLAKHTAAEVAAAARSTKVAIGLGSNQRLVADAYPVPAKLLAAVLKGDPALSNDDGDALKATAICLLAELEGSAALDAAVRLVEEPDAPWQDRAIDALAWIPTREAFEALLVAADPATTKTKDPVHARLALGRSRYAAAPAELFKRLERAAQSGDTALGKARGFIAAMGSFSYTPARALLIRIAAKAKDGVVRQAAARALKKYKSKTDLADTAGHLESPNADLRIAAVEAVFRADAAHAYDRLASYFATHTPTSETAIIALERNVKWFAADRRWRALCDRLVRDEVAGLTWDAWRVLAAHGDVRADVLLAKIGTCPLGSEIGEALFHLPASALPAVEAEVARRERRKKEPDPQQMQKADRATLRKVVKVLKAK